MPFAGRPALLCIRLTRASFYSVSCVCAYLLVKMACRVVQLDSCFVACETHVEIEVADFGDLVTAANEPVIGLPVTLEATGKFTGRLCKNL